MTIAGELGLVIRPADADDMPFVLSAWKQSFRANARPVMHGDAYFKMIQPHINRLWERAKVSVAVDSEDRDFIWAWACYEKPNKLHYIYVRGPSRRNGIAKWLLGNLLEGSIRATHWTEDAAMAARNRVSYHPGDL